MPLKDDPGGTLVARGGGLAGQNVPDPVPLGGKPQPLCDGKNIIAEGLFIPRTVGDGQDLGEVLPEAGRLEFGQRGRHVTSPFDRIATHYDAINIGWIQGEEPRIMGRNTP
jgi:hypothetical protein